MTLFSHYTDVLQIQDWPAVAMIVDKLKRPHWLTGSPRTKVSEYYAPQHNLLMQYSRGGWGEPQIWILHSDFSLAITSKVYQYEQGNDRDTWRVIMDQSEYDWVDRVVWNNQLYCQHYMPQLNWYYSHTYDIQASIAGDQAQLQSLHMYVILAGSLPPV
jgi:hypothetical protein